MTPFSTVLQPVALGCSPRTREPNQVATSPTRTWDQNGINHTPNRICDQIGVNHTPLLNLQPNVIITFTPAQKLSSFLSHNGVMG